MRITLKLEKTLEQNAASYFAKAKKAKKKIEGALVALEQTKTELERIEKKKALEEQQQQEKESRKKEWYEKFRWFITSSDFLCVGGRDATSNEVLIKKQASEEEYAFHTEMAGSPFFVVKTEKELDATTKQEVAQMTASTSRAWKLKHQLQEVFCVKVKQLSKTPKSGEYIEKGSFIVSGKRELIKTGLEFSIGLTEDKKVMGGPLSAVKKHCTVYFEIEQADEKTSDVAKKLNRTFKTELDDIVRVLPAGGCRIKKDRKKK